MPNLALSWTSSDNLKVWTFKLRQGVKFHDGSDFTSKDAADQLNRILDPKNKARGRAFITAIAKAEAVDPHTVQYTLKNAWLPFLGAISSINLNGLITSHKAIEAKTQNRHPIGTGPFVFKKWAGGDRIVVERNPNYWNKDAAHLDKIIFRIMPDTQTRFASLKSGEVDVIWTDRGNSIVRAQKDADLTTITRDGAGAKITFFNTSKPPLDDQRVRAALSHAFSQQAILNVTWKNTVPFTTNPYLTHFACANDKYRKHDLAKAKALIAEYGKPVNLEMIHTTTPRGRELGEVMQQLYKQIGVTMKLIPVDQNTLVKRVFTNDYQISGWRIANSSDVGPQLFALSFSKSRYNLTRYKMPELDEVAMAMRTATTAKVSQEKLCEMATMINESGHITYRGGNRYHVFTRNNVKGVSITRNGRAQVWDAWKSN